MMQSMFIKQVYVLFEVQVPKKRTPRYMQVIFFKHRKEKSQFFLQVADSFFYRMVFYRCRHFRHQGIHRVFSEWLVTEHEGADLIKMCFRSNNVGMGGFARCNALRICKMFQ